jgi:hypothetical protein
LNSLTARSTLMFGTLNWTFLLLNWCSKWRENWFLLLSTLMWDIAFALIFYKTDGWGEVGYSVGNWFPSVGAWVLNLDCETHVPKCNFFAIMFHSFRATPSQILSITWIPISNTKTLMTCKLVKTKTNLSIYLTNNVDSSSWSTLDPIFLIPFANWNTTILWKDTLHSRHVMVKTYTNFFPPWKGLQHWFFE